MNAPRAHIPTGPLGRKAALGPTAGRASAVRPTVPRRVRLRIVVALVLLAGGWLWLRDSGLVAVKNVEVRGLNGPQAPAIAAALTGAAEDMTTLNIRQDALDRAASAFPEVRAVRADPRPPNGLTLTVIAEPPVAVATGDGRSVPVAADGSLLRGAVRESGLPIVRTAYAPAGGRIAGDGARDALAVAAAAPEALRARVKRLGSARGFGLTAWLRDGPKVHFGSRTDLDRKWRAAARVLADRTARGATYVDVRVPTRPAAGGVGVSGTPETGVPTYDPVTGLPVATEPSYGTP